MTSIQQAKATDVVVDRSRISYGDIRRYTAAQYALTTAKTLAEVDAACDVLDAIAELAVTAIPADWFVEGTAEAAQTAPGWLRYVRADKIGDVRAAVEGRKVGEAGASDSNSG